MFRWLGRLVLVALAGLAPALLAIFVNVATGGTLPPSLARYENWTWPSIVVLSLVLGGLTAWQQFRKPSHGSGSIVGRYVNQTSSNTVGRDQNTTVNNSITVNSSLTVRVPAELPPAISDFVGRSTQREKLRRRLTAASATTIVSSIDGRAGVGKSELAIRVAHDLRDWFPDGQLYVDLRDGESDRPLPVHVHIQFLHSLGFVDGDIPAEPSLVERTYRTALSGKRVIVVLDNATDEAQVRPLLPGGHGCAVLVTSRARVHLPGATPLTLEQMNPREAIALLAKLAGRNRIYSDVDSAATLARQCGFLPLALRIAGAKLAARASWTVADLVRRLADERRRLEELQEGDLAVRSSFSKSYERLEPTAALVFRRLGLLESADYTADVAAMMADIPREDAAKCMEQLVDAQLMEPSGPDRYRFLDLLRAFAREKAEAIDPTSSRAAAVEGVLRYYLAVLQKSYLLAPTPMIRIPQSAVSAFTDWAGALVWLEVEQTNLIAGVRQAASLPIHSSGDVAMVSMATEMAEYLFDFLRLRRQWTEWQMVGDSALRAARRVDDLKSEGKIRIKLGIGQYDQGHPDEAKFHFEQASTIGEEIADRFLEGSALNELGLIHRDEGNYGESIRIFNRALIISRELHDRHIEAKTLNNLGILYLYQGDYEKAIPYFEEDLMICRIMGDVQGEAETLLNLGEAYRCQERVDKASHSLQQSLRLFREAGDHHNAGWTLYLLGLLMDATGITEARREYWADAARTVAAFSDPEANELRALVEQT
jgi:tetratricopeptide (TPR) repeat protein